MSEPFWTPLGGQPVDYEGAWDEAIQYAPGDVVIRNGVAYLAVNPSLGSEPSPALGVVVPRVVARQTAAQEATAAAEMTMWSYAVPANALGSDRLLRVMMFGDLMPNFGGGGEYWLMRLKFGGTTFIENALGLGSLAAQRQPFVMELFLMNLGVTNAQAIWGRLHHHRPIGSLPAAGIGGGNMNGHDGGWTAGLTTMANIDTTAERTFAFTVQPSQTGGAFRIRSAIAEIV